MVRFAIVGCGRISSVHLDAIRKAPDALLCAVCDIVPERAKKTGAENGVPYYTDLAQMLERERPDVVMIGTPSGLHGEHASVCAAHGVHILCEKPLEITSEKLDNMIRDCREAGVKLGGIFQRRTYSAAKAAKAAAEKGKLGALVLCDGCFKYSRDMEYYRSDAWRGTWALDGGGALMNQCIHGIDLMIQLCGEIESVTARCGTLARDIEVEDTALVLAKFKNGAMGVIEGTTVLAEGEDTVFDLNGTEGGISFGDHSFYKWKTKDGTPMPEVNDSQGGKNCGWVGVSEGHALLVQDMAEAVLQDREPMIPAEDARRAVDVILAIYESSRTGKEVRVKGGEV